jgi:hypothetical protein
VLPQVADEELQQGQAQVVGVPGADAEEIDTRC